MNDDDDRSRSFLTTALLAIVIPAAAAFVIRRSKRGDNNDERRTTISNSTVNEDNPCNDPTCLRCRPNAPRHVESLRRNGERLRRLIRLDGPTYGGVRSSILRLAEGDRHPCEDVDDGPLEPPPSGQDPTVFRLPGLRAVPIHARPRGEDGSGVGGCCGGTKEDDNGNDEKEPPQPCVCQTLWDGDLSILEASCTNIRDELLSVLDFCARSSASATSSSSASSSSMFVPFDSAVHDGTGMWSAIHLWRKGVKNEEACSVFPVTTTVLERLEHRMAGQCTFGSVYFSRLAPGTHVTPHCGPCNARLRCHLPLVVPGDESTNDNDGNDEVGIIRDARGEENNLGDDSLGEGPTANGTHARRSDLATTELRVGLKGTAGSGVLTWRFGKVLLFDDSFVHSAQYGVGGDANVDGDERGDRIVLIVDVWHPDLSHADRAALGVLFPPGS